MTDANIRKIGPTQSSHDSDEDASMIYMALMRLSAYAPLWSRPGARASGIVTVRTPSLQADYLPLAAD